MRFRKECRNLISLCLVVSCYVYLRNMLEGFNNVTGGKNNKEKYSNNYEILMVENSSDPKQFTGLGIECKNGTAKRLPQVLFIGFRKTGTGMLQKMWGFFLAFWISPG